MRALYRVSRVLVLALAIWGLGLGTSFCQEKSVRPGINEPFQNPDVKEYIGKFETESREIYAERKRIVDACPLKPGMTVADIGAGTGLFSRMFAAAVGSKGKVYAVDIASKFIEHIEKTCKEGGFKNVFGIVCTPTSVELPPNSIDLAFICDTYHHFEFPHKTMTSIHRAMRSGGKVVVIDFHRIEGKSREWVLNHVRAGQEVFTKEIVSNGFKLVEEKKLLKENYYLVFEKVEARKEPLLIEPEELQKNPHPSTRALPHQGREGGLREGKGRGLRILDTRSQSEYAKGHLPGAVRVDVKAWQQIGSKDGGFHDAKAWGKEVGRLGISDGTQVVVYGSNLPDTARIWWTLKYLDLRNVSILDGGWELWSKEKRPSDTSTPTIEIVNFEPKFQTDRLEEIDTLKKSLQSGELMVVDARSSGEFTGDENRGKRGGHIPGAKHLEWKELLAEDGRFKSPEQLRALFRQRGILPDQTAVTC